MSTIVSESQQALQDLGFTVNGKPILVDGIAGKRTTQAVRWFQAAWVKTELKVDGIIGGLTAAALKEARLVGGQLTANFSLREFASKGNGDIRVDRDLVISLQELREAYGAPIAIRSGYRDPAHNKKVGGATGSQHLYGRAADLIWTRWPLRLDAVRELQLFSGIGYYANTNNVLHVDVRPNATRKNPTTWSY